MPLLDHFHPPIIQRRNWVGFHILWTAALVEKLNRGILGNDYFAEMQVHFTNQLEVDITDQEMMLPTNGVIATVTKTAWAPPVTSLIVPTTFPDDIEVQVFSTSSGSVLVAAIELVSPDNKDRPETRQAFAAKCVSYLTRGIGLIVVDIVTHRLANLHNEVMTLFGQEGPFLLGPETMIYAVAYRPSRKPSGDQIEVWRTRWCWARRCPRCRSP